MKKKEIKKWYLLYWNEDGVYKFIKHQMTLEHRKTDTRMNRITKEELKKLKRISSPTIGNIYYIGDNFHFKHPKRTYRLVYITSGQYEVNGKISNFWYWRDVNEDGTLGKDNCGYGNFYIPKQLFKAETKITVA